MSKQDWFVVTVSIPTLLFGLFMLLLVTWWLCELFADVRKDIARVDAPKESNAFNCAKVDIGYFRPKPSLRLTYDGQQGAIVIPDEVVVQT